MRKTKIIKIFALIIGILACSACSTYSNKSYTFTIENGDKIKLTVDTSDKYSLTQKDGRFSITYDDKSILQGFFVTEDGYNNFIKRMVDTDKKVETYNEILTALKTSKKINFIEVGKKDDNTYFLYEYKGQAGTERHFVVWVNHANTGVVLGSLNDVKDAKEAFSKLTISVE